MTGLKLNSISRRQALLTGLAVAGASALPDLAVAASGHVRLAFMAANVHKGIGSSDFYVANSVGFFKDEKLDVDVHYAANASQAAQLVAAGKADIGRFSYDPAIIGYNKGLRLKGFYQFYQELIFYLGIPEDSPIHTLQDLRGKKVGVSNMGSTAVGVLRSMLKTAKIPLNEVQLVPVGVAATALAARRAGRIDAYMLWNEMYAIMQGAGEKLRFIRSKTLGKVGGNSYFAQAASFSRNPDAIMRFARAIAKASVFIQANYDATAKIYLKVNPHAGSANNPKEVAKISQELRFWSKDWRLHGAKQKYGEFNFDHLRAYAEALKSEDRLQTIPPLHEIFTNKLINGANQFDADAVRRLARHWV